MKTLSTEITLTATPAEVWAVLMDFSAYGDWNPFVTKIDGPSEFGAKLEITLSPPGGRSMRMKPEVVAVEPERHFAWLGHLMVTGLFDGEHHFELEPTPDGGTRLHHYENFEGLLLPFLGGMLDGSTRQGFEAMNAALRERLEQGQKC